MSTERVNNAGVLNRLIADKILTPHSVAALKVALDGWHDTTISDFAGIPDKHVGKLFTFDDVAEISVGKLSSPVPLGAGSWSLRISTYPIGGRTTFKNGACRGSMFTMDNASSLTVASNVNIAYALDGADFSDTGVGGATEQSQMMQMSPEFLTSSLKLCGMAIEVINTTPTLTKGGLVTACNVPQPQSTTSFCGNVGIATGVGAGTVYPLPMRMVNTPPKNLGEMVKFSPFQNKADDGVYINARMQFQDQTPYCMPVSPVLFTDDLTHNAATIPNVPIYLVNQSSVVVGAGTINGYGDVTNWFDMDSPVIIFSNLSDTTTLTIRVRWFGQIVPDEDQNIFLRASHPAPIYDPNFFEIYSRACGLIPQACAFTENPSGEWWKTALSAIGGAAGPLLLKIPHPLAKAAGLAAIGGSAYLSMSAEDKKAARKQRNNNGKYGPGMKKDAYGTIKPRKPRKRLGGIPNTPPAPPPRGLQHKKQYRDRA
jgi:hypothetical protein